MRRTLLCVAGSLVALLAGTRAQAAQLMTGLGGPQGYGTNCMPPNDDGSWPENGPVSPSPTGLDISSAFPNGIQFYAGTYTKVWINNNGNLSFQGAISTYTPDAFPGAPQPMIAPYWADVDTRTASTCDVGDYLDGEGYPAGATCMEPATDGVWWSITPGQFVVTWDSVGFYECHTTPVMSFQVILTAAAACGGGSGMDFDIEFRYANCGWEAGDASGGQNGFCQCTPASSCGCTPAQAGFDSAVLPDGGAEQYASLPMSRQNGIGMELCNNSNLTPPQPGVWQFLVRGGNIECPSAGQACNTGMPGICAQGQIECGVDGGSTCQPLTGPQAMQCNGLDNNCDGVVDNGPCPSGEVCDGTACVVPCSEGQCPTGQTCSMGLCIDTDCVNVTCPAGQRCSDGMCVDACSGITCPIGQVCRDGACVDPCMGLNCGAGQVCNDGMCIPACPCTECTGTEVCEDGGTLAGQCVAADCATVTCPAGEVCQSGTCVDACTGAVCPPGQTCMTGMCVSGSATDGGLSEGGGLMAPDGGTGSMDGGPDSGSGFGAAGKGSGGCGCRVAETGGSAPWAMGLGVGLAAVVARRRKRRKARRA